MIQEIITLPEIHLVGLTARTNNKNEMDAKLAKIGSIANQYWSKQTANQFKSRTNPGTTFSVYTEYESNEHADYTYFIGEQVDSLEQQDLHLFKTLIIPASQYKKFTTQAGEMPSVVISAWMDIWKMTENDFGGKRKYIADFEVFDQRAMDPKNAVVDIYIGIEN